MNDEEVVKKLQIENITLASINKRAIASFIDEILISMIFFFVISDKLTELTSPDAIVAYTQSLMVYVLVMKFLYQTLFIGMYGATLGKMAMKIKVIDPEYLTIPHTNYAFIRSLVRILGEMLFYIGFVVAMFSPLKITWHDKFAKTLVVNA